MLSEYYFIRNWEKIQFIVTPDELRFVLDSAHHVSCDGVKKGYIESDPNVFFDKYNDLYRKLTCGEKLSWKHHYAITYFSIGLTETLSNCLYTPTSKLAVPNFLEPCVLIDTFCFCLYKGKLSTAFSPIQFPENVVGLRLSFPTKVEFVKPTEKWDVGIVDGEGLDDYETYQQMVARIRLITKPLKLEINEKLYRPSVRVSEEAKMNLGNYYFIVQNSIKIL